MKQMKIKNIIPLFYLVWRHMPLLSLAWLTIPIVLGMLVVPGLAAQRELVDLFVHESAADPVGRQMNEWIGLVWAPLAIFTTVSLIRVSLSALHNIIDAKFRDQATMKIQAEVHHKAVSVPLEMMEQTEYYDLLQRAKSVAGTDLFGVLQNVIAFLRLLFELIGLMLVAWLAHPVIGFLLVVVFMISFVIRLESDLVVRKQNRDLTRSGRQSDYLKEELTKPETVREMRIFGSLEYLTDKWSGMMRDSLSLRMGARRREIKRGMLVSTVQILGLIGTVTWMLSQLKSGDFTAGTFVIVFLAIRQAYGISGRMAFPIGKIVIQSDKVNDLADYLSMKQKSDSQDTGPLANEQLKLGRIIFNNVNFQYLNSNLNVLRDINLRLNPGETVALVGENGAGKSTLVKLLLGLYHPTSGSVTWDGIDYKRLDYSMLRRSSSAVFQEFVRYESTLRDNVGFGATAFLHDDSAINHALEAGGLADVEQFEGGLETSIGLLSAGGRELSGGQWQRLAIARAAIRNAGLLVLDEPTSAIDPVHETELYRSFQALAAGKTVLFVSHRLGWARYADRIVVLKGGEIVEEGDHESLMAANGVYAAMFHAQASWYQEA
ncbi:ABC transporter ATP-binding protein [Paenibacillus sp. YIM B09110]|uniref:ABC transporter ATP-binding protein n=1 Tax=Paenibacillus sp. YIM B09110 TaxID=3126102 RepID=UPI00301BC881